MSDTEKLKEEVKKQIAIMKKNIQNKDKIINNLMKTLENSDED